MMPFPSTVPGDHALILRAAMFAVRAHAYVAQERDYVGGPYSVHPLAVAAMVAEFTMDPHVIAAALLHDVIEDTHFTLDDIRYEFGERVGAMVDLLTEYPEPVKREVRKAKQRDRLASASADVQLIKAMDLIHNRESIQKYNPGFAKTYLKEMAELVAVMDKLDPRAQMMLADESATDKGEVTRCG